MVLFFLPLLLQLICTPLYLCLPSGQCWGRPGCLCKVTKISHFEEQPAHGRGLLKAREFHLFRYFPARLVTIPLILSFALFLLSATSPLRFNLRSTCNSTVGSLLRPQGVCTCGWADRVNLQVRQACSEKIERGSLLRMHDYRERKPSDHVSSSAACAFSASSLSRRSFSIAAACSFQHVLVLPLCSLKHEEHKAVAPTMMRTTFLPPASREEHSPSLADVARPRCGRPCMLRPGKFSTAWAWVHKRLRLLLNPGAQHKPENSNQNTQH